jgi:hypothetical protein
MCLDKRSKGHVAAPSSRACRQKPCERRDEVSGGLLGDEVA